MKFLAGRLRAVRPSRLSLLVLSLICVLPGCGGSAPAPPPPPISVSLSPVRGGLALSQSLTFTAAVQNDATAQGVTWSTTLGSLSGQTATTAVLTANGGPGTYTVTATSKADSTKSASATIGVTDLAGVFTYHNDLSRDGANLKELALSPANVNTATFGKLFSCPVDGAIYAQPLWIPQLTISGAKHNVVVVATQHNSAYAFDADSNASPCVALWHANLTDASHGGSGSEITVPTSVSPPLIGQGYGNIYPEVGVTGTPVIDPATNTLYVVSKSVITSTVPPAFFQRLHALDLTTGAETFGGPKTIAATVPGTGYDSSGGSVAFNPQTQNQRAGLALVNGIVYLCWGSHEDKDFYHGWVMAFSASNLNLLSVYNDTPNGNEGGIWMGGGAPAADASNNLYVITGNGDYDGASDYGDSILKLSSSLAVVDSFTPSVQLTLEQQDLDLGSGGTALLVDMPNAPVGFQHLLVGGGKGTAFNGELYVANRDQMGQYHGNDAGIVQEFPLNSPIFATPAFWQNKLYLAGAGGPLVAFTVDPNRGQFTNTAAPPQSAAVFNFPGVTPSVSANGATNGIVWALDNSQYCTPAPVLPACGASVLHAYDANNLAAELWNSSLMAADKAGLAVKFTVPTIANGKVYVGTRGSDTGTGSPNPGELDVYGLKPN